LSGFPLEPGGPCYLSSLVQWVLPVRHCECWLVSCRWLTAVRTGGKSRTTQKLLASCQTRFLNSFQIISEFSIVTSTRPSQSYWPRPALITTTLTLIVCTAWHRPLVLSDLTHCIINKYTRRMAIANYGTCVSFCNQPKAQFGYRRRVTPVYTGCGKIK